MKKIEKLHQPHCKYWDCYNDEPLGENHAKESSKITTDIAIKFVSWLCNTKKIYNILELKQTEKELFKIFINNHYDKRTNK